MEVLYIPAPSSHSALGSTDLGLCSPCVEHPNSLVTKPSVFHCPEGISLVSAPRYTPGYTQGLLGWRKYYYFPLNRERNVLVEENNLDFIIRRGRRADSMS